ncbi:MAG: hypothetical protein E7643_04355 [Ruminococcaceae bacterium]|nr:hypothetical protein [Oscillospiraceae bacterium]
MSLNGLERITGKILSDAQEQADRILADAQAECDRITADYAARAEQIRDTLNNDAERAGKDFISRAKSTAATNKRNLLLQTQSELIDDVFDGTLEQLLAMEAGQYNELLAGLLAAAFAEQLEAERSARMLAAEEEWIDPSTYEVVLNARDKERCGKTLIESVRKKLGAKVPSEKLDMLKISDKTVSIDGGLILRCGDVEANCSLSLLIAQLREKLEAEVGHALFDVKKQN